jgi:hypothetical protein
MFEFECKGSQKEADNVGLGCTVALVIFVTVFIGVSSWYDSKFYEVTTIKTVVEIGPCEQPVDFFNEGRCRVRFEDGTSAIAPFMVMVGDKMPITEHLRKDEK